MDIAGSASRAKRVESHDIYARPRLASQIYLSLNVRLHTWWELRVHYELFTVHAFESLSGGKSDANASIAIDMWWSKWLSSSHACLHACKEENHLFITCMCTHSCSCALGNKSNISCALGYKSNITCLCNISCALGYKSNNFLLVCSYSLVVVSHGQKVWSDGEANASCPVSFGKDQFAGRHTSTWLTLQRCASRGIRNECQGNYYTIEKIPIARTRRIRRLIKQYAKHRISINWP